MPVILVAAGTMAVGGTAGTACVVTGALDVNEGRQDIQYGLAGSDKEARNSLKEAIGSEAYYNTEMIAAGLSLCAISTSPYLAPFAATAGAPSVGSEIALNRKLAAQEAASTKTKTVDRPPGKGVTTAMRVKSGSLDPVREVKFAGNAGTRPRINAASMAKKWQGSGDYPGVDEWKNITLKKGTKIWGGAPGQTNFYTSEKVIQEANSDATKIFKGLQVSKGKYPFFRPGMTQYEVKEDIIAGYSKALSNPHHGAGGLEQYFVPNPEDVLIPIKSNILTNR